jgi:L-amino acid N-acyltransferase YncA
MNIRIAQPCDLACIVEIYNQAVFSRRSTADLSPLQPEDREAWFAEHSPAKYPIFVAEIDGHVIGWCSLSAYRPGRMALRFTAEISCYVDQNFQHQGIGKTLLNHAMAACPSLEIKNVFGIVLEKNTASRRMMDRLGFAQWGCMPRVAEFDGEECGHLYFGKRVWD